MKTYNFPSVYRCIESGCKGWLIEKKKGTQLVCNVCKKEVSPDEAIDAWLDSQRL